MTPFTESEMLTELKTIFLYEADHIAHGASREKAAAFIGFEAEQYWNENPDRVDLTGFAIAGAFERGFHFAFLPSATNLIGGEDIQDLDVFMQGVPRVGGQRGEGGETHLFMTPEGLCRTVADTVHARWKLEWEEAGTFSVRELTLLANMTEGAVRNALAARDGGLRAIPGSKPVAIAHEDARTWLAGRRGFRPSPKRARDDAILHEELRALQSAKAVSHFIDRRLSQRFGNLKNAAAELGWPPDYLDAWRNGGFAYDFDQASALARALDLDEPTLIGKSLEVTLRRDAEKTEA